MRQYEVDPKSANCIGLFSSEFQMVDAFGRHVSELDQAERSAYMRNLKSHLWRDHGLDSKELTVNGLPAHPVTLEEFEVIHYQLHLQCIAHRPHTHRALIYPHDLGVSEGNEEAIEAANLALAISRDGEDL